MINPGPILPVTDTVFVETTSKIVASLTWRAGDWKRVEWNRNWGKKLEYKAHLKETEREMRLHGFHPLRFTGGMIRYGVPF